MDFNLSTPFLSTMRECYRTLKAGFPDQEYQTRVEQRKLVVREEMQKHGVDAFYALAMICDRVDGYERGWVRAAVVEMIMSKEIVPIDTHIQSLLEEGLNAMTQTADVDTDLELDLGEIDIGDVDLDVSIEESPTIVVKTEVVEPLKLVEFVQPAPPSARTEIYFDLETIPDESRRPLFGLDEPAEAKPISNPEVGDYLEFMKKTIPQITEIVKAHNPSDVWLDGFETWERHSAKPREGIMKLAKEIRAERSSVENAEAAKIKTMSVSPEMCRIAAMGIGWTESGNDITHGFVVGNGIEEAELLEWFWATVKNCSLVVGFNCLHFDLPVILERSAILGVQPSRRFDLKPWGGDVLDLMKARWPTNGQMKLKEVARALGLEIPAGDVDGSQVHELYKSDPAKLAEYVKSDVYLTQQLRRKWRGYFC